MQEPLDITIRKSAAGWILMVIVGSLTIAGTLAIMYWLLHTGDLDRNMFGFISFAVVIELLSTIVKVYVYTLANIHLTTDGITVTDYTTLFRSVIETTEWADVEDVTVTRPNALADLLGYATLQVQTAGEKVNLVMPYTPQPDYWREQIAKYGDSMKQPASAA